MTPIRPINPLIMDSLRAAEAKRRMGNTPVPPPNFQGMASSPFGSGIAKSLSDLLMRGNLLGSAQPAATGMPRSLEDMQRMQGALTKFRGYM